MEFVTNEIMRIEEEQTNRINELYRTSREVQAECENLTVKFDTWNDVQDLNAHAITRLQETSTREFRDMHQMNKDT